MFSCVCKPETGIRSGKSLIGMGVIGKEGPAMSWAGWAGPCASGVVSEVRDTLGYMHQTT